MPSRATPAGVFGRLPARAALKGALASQLCWLQVIYCDLKEPFQPPPSRISICYQDSGRGGVFEEEFCEAVIVPDVKIAFGVIRRQQTPLGISFVHVSGFAQFSCSAVLISGLQRCTQPIRLPQKERRLARVSSQSPALVSSVAVLHVPMPFSRGGDCGELILPQ